VALASYAAVTAALVPFLDEEQILDVALIYLLLTLVVAALWGYWVGLAGALLADLLVNFFFVQPLYTLTVQEPANVVTLGIFLAVALVGASMLALLRRQVQITAARAAETAMLLNLSQEVARAVSPRDAMDRLCSAVSHSLKARGCSIVRQGAGWQVVGSSGGFAALPREEEAVAEEAIRTGDIARMGPIGRLRTFTKGATPAEHITTFVPFGTSSMDKGVLRISGAIGASQFAHVDQILRAFADEASMTVTRARLAEEARRVDALQRADEFKTVLLSSVSHDLRSPLTAIKAAVGSLRDEEMDWSDEDRASFLATIEGQTDRLTATVSNILEMSRLEGGAVRSSIESIEVVLLFDEVCRATSELTEGRCVTLDCASGVRVRADYGLLLQSLVNLVENAAKYSTAGAPIQLRCEGVGGRTRLTVRDEGPGIPEGDLTHVFEKFYRGSKVGQTKGSGLGLAIVKAMVELCGGSVRVQSGPAGTEFTIELATAAPHSS
jgi:two-component system sensor histidine kinase KdpD